MQLKTQWINDNQVAIIRGSKVIAVPQVRYFKERDRFLDTQGNCKTKGVFGMINNISNGCFRGCTGFGKCDLPCYEKCYANTSVYALKNKHKGFNICTNGISNNFFSIRIPENKNYKLNTLKFWRISSESSDMSLAMSLGIVEKWVENNPDKFFTGISSDYFFVSADKLRKFAKYDNILVSHTISDWFSDDDLENRISQIERFQKYGVNTAVWVTTNPQWISNKKDKKRHDKMIGRVLDIVTPNQIIEVPFHSNRVHCDPILNLNPLGSCCSTDDKKCKSCKLLCGMPYLLSKRRGKK